MSHYSEQYAKLSNTELLSIIDDPADYQPEALEAARSEIANRKVPEDELAQIKKALETKSEARLAQQQKLHNANKKTKARLVSMFEAISPVQQGAPTAEKLIRLITLVFTFSTLYIWYKEFDLVRFILADSPAGWDMSMVEYFLPLIMLPVALVLFGMRKKAGWILMTAYISYSAILALVLVVMTWDTEASSIPALETLFPKTSPIIHFVGFAFFAGVWWIMMRQDIRKQFGISKQSAIRTNVIAGILTLVLIALI
ncbi:MAG: hypothetical protein AB8F95_09535 [Bacteroidia bacterium]